MAVLVVRMRLASRDANTITRGQSLKLGGDCFKTNKRSSFYTLDRKSVRGRLTNWSEERETREIPIRKKFSQ